MVPRALYRQVGRDFQKFREYLCLQKDLMVLTVRSGLLLPAVPVCLHHLVNQKIPVDQVDQVARQIQAVLKHLGHQVTLVPQLDQLDLKIL